VTAGTERRPAAVTESPKGMLTYRPASPVRNVVAAGRCTVVSGGMTYEIDRIEPCSAEVGMRAFGQPPATVRTLLRRTEFHLLRRAAR
jgi:hypothetical protein